MQGKTGKIDLEVFEGFIAGRLGKKDKRVLVGPQTGVDAAVIDMGEKVLIIAEDPIFPMPEPTLEDFGYYTVHIGASDIAVMGVKPEFMTYSLLMPPNTSDKDFRDTVDSIHRTALELDIAIVGGHTGYYPAVTVPTIGGITVFSFADKDAYVTPASANVGDKVILTKGPAIEATGLLAKIYEKELLEKLPKSLVERAIGCMKEMSVVKDSLTAMEAGGVRAMHDATEGGVIGGLFEVASASKVGMFINESDFIFPEHIEEVMKSLEIDPLEAISEGTLIITAKPSNANAIVEALKKVGIVSSIVGDVVPEAQGKKLKRRDGSVIDLYIPKQDPFWPAFFKGMESR